MTPKINLEILLTRGNFNAHLKQILTLISESTQREKKKNGDGRMSLAILTLKGAN